MEKRDIMDDSITQSTITLQVKVKLAARIDLECLEECLNNAEERMGALQALDIVMRHSPSLR